MTTATEADVAAVLEELAALPLSPEPWLPVGDNSILAPPARPNSFSHPEPELVQPLMIDEPQYHGSIVATLRAAKVAYTHRERMTYTQGPRRWSGIDEHMRSIKGGFPPDADCSAFVTWCFWDGFLWLHPRDFLNGDEWRGGFTGTLAQHGAAVSSTSTLPCDVVLYGGTPWAPQHAAMTIGNHRVISFGSPGGPKILPIEFGMPIVAVRRMVIFDS